MATQNERHVGEFVEASIAEMMQIQGGATLAEYALLLAVVREDTRPLSAGDLADWQANYGVGG